MICKFCKKIMIDNESTKNNKSYICNCGATCDVYFRDIPASQRKNARAVGIMKTSESWFNPQTRQVESENKNERIF